MFSVPLGGVYTAALCTLIGFFGGGCVCEWSSDEFLVLIGDGSKRNISVGGASVGEVQPHGCRTDGPSDDGFVLVSAKKGRKARSRKARTYCLAAGSQSGFDQRNEVSRITFSKQSC